MSISIHSRNSTYALIRALGTVAHMNDEVSPRGQATKELLAVNVHLQNPLDRCYILPKRNNNVFAQVAESLWVMSGRDDMEFLSHYLPRAPDYSDDGKVWRGGYGKRLRHWHGINNIGGLDYVDQFAVIIKLLKKDSDTRRAVMVIFDPAKDYAESKDIPCNDLIQFLIRNGKLHMHVFVRSQDILWGFSGINTFEWSVLHEFMAFWTGTEVGEYSQFASSFHLYEKHYKRATSITRAFSGKTIYDIGIERVKFDTPFSDFDPVMTQWFAIEGNIRKSDVIPREYFDNDAIFTDIFLDTALHMMCIWKVLKEWSPKDIIQLVNNMRTCDLKVAVVEHLIRDDRFEVSQFNLPNHITAFLSTFLSPTA